MCSRVGIIFAASSATGFIGIVLFLRTTPSAVNRAFASASASRSTIAFTPNPEKRGRIIPPILAIANSATAISGTMGM